MIIKYKQVRIPSTKSLLKSKSPKNKTILIFYGTLEKDIRICLHFHVT